MHSNFWNITTGQHNDMQIHVATSYVGHTEKLQKFQHRKPRWYTSVLVFFSVLHFLPARRYASAGTIAMALCLSVSVSVCLSQVGVLPKRLNESSWFLAWELPSSYLTLCKKKFGYLKHKGTFLWNFVQNSGLRILLRHIDCRDVLST